LRREAAQIRAALGGAATVAVALGAIAAVPSVGWLVPLELVGGIGNGLLNVTAGALLLARTPDPLRGRVSAAVSGTASAAMLGALALGGALTTELSPRTIFVIAATAGAVCVATTWVPLTRRGVPGPLSRVPPVLASAKTSVGDGHPKDGSFHDRLGTE
ncbi:MAG TPA: MFS transporter, partial [Acidimicrobiales bacterium]|nr:MFS transporter [Acidimicrobiales bacterium]